MIVEQPLHDRLAVVEGALHRERMHVTCACRRHHAPLHVGDAAVRKQHDQVDTVAVGERIDRGAAGIARGRNRDGGALATLRQHMIHQPRQQLHRHVLEGERRTVKQFQHELVGPDLVERHHGRMAEGRIGLVGHAAKIGIGDVARDERLDHLDRDFPVRATEEPRDGLGRQLRPDLGHIQAAVAGEPGQHHVAEPEFRGLAPGRKIVRQAGLQRRHTRPSL